MVKFWKPQKGWGALSSPNLPNGKDVWAHITVVEPFVPALAPGQAVEFAYREANQDSFDFVADWVHPL